MTNTDPRKAVQNVLFSLIRTYVPYIVSAVAAWLASRWDFILDEQMKTGLVLFIAGVVFGIYYAVVRVVETYVAPKFAWFLGDFRKGLTVPVYPDSIEAVIIPPGPMIPVTTGD